MTRGEGSERLTWLLRRLRSPRIRRAQASGVPSPSEGRSSLMRKLTFAVAGVVALVAASIAVAHGIDGAKTATAVSGTFSATPSGTVTTRTCTTADNKTITIADAKYTGT